MNFTTFSPARASRRSGFTLVELLTVIAIIGILAALIVPLAGVANSAKRKSEARAMIDMLDSAINQYHSKKGFYPPDNTVNALTHPFPNQLFYELWGTTVQAATTPMTYGDNFAAGDVINAGTVTSLFNAGGFMNSSADSTEIYNFLPTLKPSQLARLTPASQPPVWVLICKSPGPATVTTNANGVKINPVQYVAANPTNRPGFFDLWVDIIVAGKTNRISNWSKDPVIVSY